MGSCVVIVRQIYTWFKNHPGQWSIEELVERLPFTRKQIQYACGDLVKRGRISKVTDMQGMWELTHIKIIVPDQQVAAAVARGKPGTAVYVPRIVAHADPVFGPKNEILRGDLIPAGWRVMHGFIPDRNFGGACKWCHAETMGRDVVAVTGGVIHPAIGAQTSDWYHIGCAKQMPGVSHVTENVYWGIVKRDRRLIDPDWTVVTRYLVPVEDDL